MDQTVAGSGDPLESVKSQSKFDEHLARLQELSTDQRRDLIARAAGFEPSEIAQSLSLTALQYRKRIETARRTLGLSNA